MILSKFRAPRRFHAHETQRMDELDGLPLASFRQRSLALLVDFALVYLLRLIFHMNGKEHNAAAVGTLAWWSMEVVHKLEELLESVTYFAVALKLGKGQTPGKRLMNIRVVSLTHHSISWWQSIERGLGYAASFLEGGFGFLQFYINRNRQCVHDRIAETIVLDLRAADRFCLRRPRRSRHDGQRSRLTV